jgi:hypothetical protein
MFVDPNTGATLSAVDGSVYAGDLYNPATGEYFRSADLTHNDATNEQPRLFSDDSDEDLAGRRGVPVTQLDTNAAPPPPELPRTE